ncbi:hypothetical protein SUGI_0796120 [Cryptomeria japonica]|nr:hypothetical protein SUGI_0796120 [Cryptomeria japonica]
MISRKKVHQGNSDSRSGSLSLFHYSAEEEEEARCNCSYKMDYCKGEKSFERGQIAVMTVLPRKAFNLLVIATSGVYAGIAVFWVTFAYLALIVFI